MTDFMNNSEDRTYKAKCRRKSKSAYGYCEQTDEENLSIVKHTSYISSYK